MSTFEADVNVRDICGMTALMLACKIGHLDIVRYLASECRADVNVESDGGWTALMSTCQSGHLGIVRYLVSECCADVNVRNNDGRAALYFAKIPSPVFDFMLRHLGGPGSLVPEAWRGG